MANSVVKLNNLSVALPLAVISDCNDTSRAPGGSIGFYATNSNTANTPYKQGLTTATSGILIEIGTGTAWSSQFYLATSKNSIFARSKSGNGSTWNNVDWVKITS